MPAKLTRGLITPNQRYVCLSCRLQKSSSAGGRTTRYQHTAPPENDGGKENQDFIPKDAGNEQESASRSRIGDMIRSFMFRSDAKDKEANAGSEIESLGENKVGLAYWSSLRQSVRPTDHELG